MLSKSRGNTNVHEDRVEVRFSSFWRLSVAFIYEFHRDNHVSLTCTELAFWFTTCIYLLLSLLLIGLFWRIWKICPLIMPAMTHWSSNITECLIFGVWQMNYWIDRSITLGVMIQANICTRPHQDVFRLPFSSEIIRKIAPITPAPFPKINRFRNRMANLYRKPEDIFFLFMWSVLSGHRWS